MVLVLPLENTDFFQGPQRISPRGVENEAPLEAGMMVTDGECFISVIDLSNLVTNWHIG